MFQTMELFGSLFIFIYATSLRLESSSEQTSSLAGCCSCDCRGITNRYSVIVYEQVTRLEQTWTSLRHRYTQTAIMYEKQLKPFSKALHEGQDEWNSEYE